MVSVSHRHPTPARASVAAECVSIGLATDDEAVEATPIWKLKIVAPKLALTNTVADKFGGPPPKGFEWGKQY